MYAPLTALLLLGAPAQPPAPDKPAPVGADVKAEAEDARAVAKKLAGEYVVRLTGADKPLKLEPEPVLRWINQLERRFYGDVYVWTLDGRPEVIASLTTVFGPTRKMETEVHSLSPKLPVMSHGEKVIWEPTRAGIELKPVPGAAKPAATAPVRLQQMRALAAQFALTADYGVAKEDKEDLRLMAAPIHRYQSAVLGVTDGALFAYSKGTDPEAFLMVEARGKGDAGQWEFALARFNGNCSIRAVYAEKEVWRVERLPLKTNLDPKEPYFGLRK